MVLNGWLYQSPEILEEVMSWLSFDTSHWTLRREAGDGQATAVPGRLRIASMVLRTIFILSLIVVTVHVSIPQNETIWTAYDTPGDLVRLLLGFAVCVWLAFQLFAVPKDVHAYRTWLYLGLVAVPFTLICIAGIW